MPRKSEPKQPATGSLKRSAAPSGLAAPRMGVTAHLELMTLPEVRQAISLIQATKLEVLRFSILWNLAEPQRGVHDFSRWDARVDELNAANLEPLLVLADSASWATSAASDADWQAAVHSPPADLIDFENYVFAVVSHFHGRVRYYQIWNEPNAENFWRPTPNARRYADLLKSAYLAAKSADARSYILAAGLTDNGTELNFLETMYAAGVRGYADALAYHPYTRPDAKFLSEHVAAFRAVMQKYGDTAPLWITELGAADTVPWQGAALSEHEVGTWVGDAFAAIPDVPILWYELRDKDRTDAEGHFGLVRLDWTPKAAYEAIKSLSVS